MMGKEKLLSALKLCIPLVFIPVVAIAGTLVFDEKKHIFVSLGVAVLSLMFFSLGFERKRTGSRRAVLTSVMVALSVVGRMIPIFSPVTAMTVISGMYLGGEAGFLVGALSALLSNFIFGQGPWTPFQMIAWGIIGLSAGWLSPLLKKNKIFAVSYGVLSGIAFSLVMDVWTVLWYEGSFSLTLYLAATVTALPHTALYAVSNGVFLWFMTKPFGDKLERIKIKYGI